MINFAKDYKDAYDLVDRLMSKDVPFSLNIIGGSDTDLIIEFLKNNANLDLVPQTNIDLVYSYNGYYDLEKNSENIEMYIKTFITEYITGTRFNTVVTSEWLSIFFPQFLHSHQLKLSANSQSIKNLAKEIDVGGHGEAFFLPYNFIEQGLRNENSLFNLFSKTLPGLKVLVVSPFQKSIEENFKNRKLLFKNYDYPDFNLVTYQAPITYSGLPENLYPHDNWNSTLLAMKSDISNIDFDIALLACGSYALPLSNFIANNLSKKSIYVGGMLQIYFGIMGRRYNNIFHTEHLNLDKFIYPLEKEIYSKHINFSDTAAAEAFNAYF